MTGKKTCEIFIAMNERGGWTVAESAWEASQTLLENSSGDHARFVKLTVKMAQAAAIAATAGRSVGLNDDAPPVMTAVAVDIPDEV